MIHRDLRDAHKSGGFMWGENETLALIRTVFDDRAYQFIAVYTGLCRLASEESKRKGRQVAVFRAGFGVIGQYAGCSRSSAIRWLELLERESFIEVHHVPKTEANATERISNEYVLPCAWDIKKKREEKQTATVG